MIKINKKFLVGAAVTASLLMPWHYTVAAPRTPYYAQIPDYPAVFMHAPRDSLTDPWGSGNRECTSYISYRLHKTYHLDVSGLWGDAKYWGQVAKFHNIPVDNTPTVGSVKVITTGDTGHVAWVESVEKVPQGTRVTVSSFNSGEEGTYKVAHYINLPYMQYIHFEKVRPGTDIR